MKHFYATGLVMPRKTDRTTQVTVYPPRHIHNQNVFLQDPIKKIVTTQTGSSTKPHTNLKARRVEDSFKLASASVREVVDVFSRYPRDLFDTGSGAVREVFDCCSGASRRTTESHPKQYRSCPEPVPKRTRRASEGYPNSSRRNGRFFDHFLSALKAEIKYRCSKDIVLFTQRLRKIAEAPLMYRGCTVSVRGVYRKGTREVLKRYWRATKDLLNACTSGVDQRYSNSRGVVGVMRNRAIPLMAVWLCFSRKSFPVMALKNKGALLYGLLCFMLFNLSTAWAQSAESRTAEGQTEIKPLEVGQKVPEEFWRLKHSFLEGEVVKEGTLEAFKGKVLLLNFWETYCSPCLKNFPTLDSIQETMQGWGEIVLVNEKFSGGTKEKISASLGDQRKRWDIELKMTKIIKDEKLRLYFKHLYIPHYVLLAEDGTVLVMGSIEAFDAIRTILEIYSYNNNAIIN